MKAGDIRDFLKYGKFLSTRIVFKERPVFVGPRVKSFAFTTPANSCHRAIGSQGLPVPLKNGPARAQRQQAERGLPEAGDAPCL